MGNEEGIIDTKNITLNYRCNNVKEPIIYINLIGPPLSLIFLLFGIIKMFTARKSKSFLTKLILIIFISEAFQSISKLLQLVKYAFDDERDNKKDVDFDNARGIICQIQIVIAIASDFCSLLSTLLITLRCYDVIKNKKKFFNRGNNGLISIILDISISIILSIIFLLIDRRIVVTENNSSYKYDVRDRCTYWCWLEHYSSLSLFGVYVLILIAIIWFAFHNYCFLKDKYNKLKGESEFSEETNEIASLGVQSQTGETKEPENKKIFNQTKEELKRIQDLNLMKIKSLVYPLVTIIYWVFNATYRIVDDSYMMEYDYAPDPIKAADKEREMFEKNESWHITVQTFLVAYILMSAIRGILYGFAFIAFEEKIFFNIYKKCCRCCLKEKELGDVDDDNLNRKSTEMAENSLVEDEEDAGSSKKNMNTEMVTKEPDYEEDN